MKLLIDDARVEAIKDYFRHPEGFVNADVADLLTDRRTMLAEIERVKRAYCANENEISEILAKALGYPVVDDLPTSGEHTSTTLAAEAAARIAELEGLWNAAQVSYEEATEVMGEKIAKLEKERDHWKANHDNQVQLSQLLRDRPDLPVERTHAYRQFEALQKRETDLQYANSTLLDARARLNARIAELEAQLDAMRAELEKKLEASKTSDPDDFTPDNY